MEHIGKIVEMADLPALLAPVRAKGFKIVHCHGVFDLMHIGHIRHFQEARRLGDLLVVTVTSDPFVNKGPHRPAFTQQLRAEALASLECVDYVAINKSPGASEAIRLIRPRYYVKGKDYKDRPANPKGKLHDEEAAVAEGGGELVYTDDVMFSSSSLINNYLTPFPEEVTEYLRDFKKNHDEGKIVKMFEQVRKLKVLVVGETIIDEYCYCEAIGKSGKEPVLVCQFKSREQFAGGTVAIANHVAGFSDHVTLLSFLGTKNSQEEFIRERLRPNVIGRFLFNEGRPTIVKRRYVEPYLLQKLFEVYTIDDDALPISEEKALCDSIEAIIAEHDVVIVADYGHEMLTQAAIKLLCDRAKFLAVNTQANAGNKGFHTISAYPRANYVTLSHPELCLDMRRRNGDPKEMMLNLVGRRNYDRVTVTQGRHGLLIHDRNGGFVNAPGFTQHVVDRVGSGDAVLALTSLFAALGAPSDLLAFIGNVAGCEAVKIVGHRSFLEYNSFIKHVSCLLK